MKFKVGDKVRIVSLPTGWGEYYKNSYLGKEGRIIRISANIIITDIPLSPHVEEAFDNFTDPNWTIWYEKELELIDV